MKSHPAAEFFPLLEGAEFDALVADIREHGQLVPIIMLDDAILDGRNRWRACKKLGIEPRTVEAPPGARESPYTYVWSANLHRRHLTAGQCAALAAELEPRFAAEAKERQRAGGSGSGIFPEGVKGEAREHAANITGANPRYVSDAKRIRIDAPAVFDLVKAGRLNMVEAKDVARSDPKQRAQLIERVNRGETVRDARAAMNAEHRDRMRLNAPPLPTGQYRTIVIDPPWENTGKIERAVRPRQVGFDYPTMTEEELAALKLPAADDCHLYLWTTHRHLPTALRLAESWGFRYSCLMAWIKSNGFTPFSWMYSTEHVLFCRKGSLPLLQLGRRLDFTGTVREHSRKPDEFYDLVRDVSPGPRIDMFSREKRDGFDQWGNETDRFSAPDVIDTVGEEVVDPPAGDDSIASTEATNEPRADIRELEKTAIELPAWLLREHPLRPGERIQSRAMA